MKPFILSLQQELCDQISDIDVDASPVKGYNVMAVYTRNAILKLNDWLKAHPFADPATEIQYFKHWGPDLHARHHYFEKMYILERRRITTDPEQFRAWLLEEKATIASYSAQYFDLYSYYRINSTDKDTELFRPQEVPGIPSLYITNHTYCEASITLAHLLANDQYKKAIEQELTPDASPAHQPDTEQWTWTGTESEAVEAMIAFLETGLFLVNGKPPTHAQAQKWLKKHWNVDTRHFTEIDANNRRRKKSPHPLLDKIMRQYNLRSLRLRQ